MIVSTNTPCILSKLFTALYRNFSSHAHNYVIIFSAHFISIRFLNSRLFHEQFVDVNISANQNFSHFNQEHCRGVN